MAGFLLFGGRKEKSRGLAVHTLPRLIAEADNHFRVQIPHALLFCCSAVLLFCCSAVLLFCCSAVLLFCCSAVLL